MLKINRILDKYRVTTGVMASRPGDPFGSFIIKAGFLFGDQRRLQTIVTDGQMQGSAPEFRWEHVSATVLHYPKGATKPRFFIPTWAEMCGLKDLFWDSDDCVIQFHPPNSDYIDVHKFVLHLWRPLDCEIPRPNSLLVGPKAGQQK